MRPEKALYAAVAAIYFADNSDYESALWEVVKELNPSLSELLANDERKAYRQAALLAGLPEDEA